MSNKIDENVLMRLMAKGLSKFLELGPDEGLVVIDDNTGRKYVLYYIENFDEEYDDSADNDPIESYYEIFDNIPEFTVVSLLFDDAKED